MARDLTEESAQLNPHAVHDSNAIHWNLDIDGNIIDELFKIDMGDNVRRQMVLNVFDDRFAVFLSIGKRKDSRPGAGLRFIPRKTVLNSVPSTINFSGGPFEK